MNVTHFDRTLQVPPIRVAFLDPPYLGMAAAYSRPGTPEYHPDAMRWDDPDEHRWLMARADEEYPDGWAYSLSAASLRTLLPLAPEGIRVMAWVKPFVMYTQAWPVYAWEPVFVRVKHTRGKLTRERPKDWVADRVGAGYTERFFGAKPPEFCRWIFDIFALGEHPDDVLDDLFPGSGAVGRAWDEYRGAATTRGVVTQDTLFGAAP